MDATALVLQRGVPQDLLDKQDHGPESLLSLQLKQVLQQQQQQQQQQRQLQEYQLQEDLYDHHGVYLEHSAMPMEVGEADPLKDPVFNYISDMYVENEDKDRTCMFIDCTSYQAMANELNELISDPSSSESSGCVQQQQQQEQNPSLNADLWMEGLFKRERQVSSPVSVHSAPEFGRLVPDDEYYREVHGFLDEVQNDMERRRSGQSLLVGGAELATATSAAAGAAPDAAAAVKVQSATVQADGRDGTLKKKKKRQGKEVDLCSLLVECAEVLADQQLSDDKCGPDLIWWSGDLSTAANHFVSGTVRDVKMDGKALEAEEALRTELHKMLIECAQAVSSDDVTKAYQMVNSIRDKVSPRGSGTERMVFYFAEALVARITGTGALLYTAMASSKPPFSEMLKAHHHITKYLPNIRICHYFLNQNILNMTEGASRIHIVDYGILYGFQWPCLMKALAARKGGPPHLRITGIDFPQPGFKPAERVEETGRKLAEFAKQVGVPFEYHAIATAKWESVQASTLQLRHDELLVVNSMFRLRHLLDESVMADSPRKIVLSRIRSFKPKVFIQSVLSGNYNAPFFLTRFREAMQHYSAVFDAVGTAMCPELPERHLIEQSILGREILNVIACEGVERVERAESYRHWQSRTQRAGFEQLPLCADIASKARAMLGTYHKGFGIGQDAEWLLLGWKDRVLHAMCTWKVAGT